MVSFITLTLFSKETEFDQFLDLPYGKHKRQKLDLFTPKVSENNPPLPLVIWIHGGAWRSGDKSTGRQLHRLPALVATGRYAGAAISYRLSGDSKWPAQILDCRAAVRWLRGNAKSYGIDTERFSAWGSSAGGHLASMLGTASPKDFLDPSINAYNSFSSSVQAVINYYGPSAFLLMDSQPSTIKHNSPTSPESQLIGHPIQTAPKLALNASPLSHVSPDDSPHFIFHGMKDPLVPFQQSLLLNQKLLKFGVPTALVTVRDGGHKMPSKFTKTLVLPFWITNFTISVNFLRTKPSE